jgi:hypothetical protein
MVQFRNFVVHRYERIDTEILVEIVNNRLDDFEKFRDEVLCGTPVYCADENRCAGFASLTAREYVDEMAMCGRWAKA